MPYNMITWWLIYILYLKKDPARKCLPKTQHGKTMKTTWTSWNGTKKTLKLDDPRHLRSKPFKKAKEFSSKRLVLETTHFRSLLFGQVFFIRISCNFGGPETTVTPACLETRLEPLWIQTGPAVSILGSTRRLHLPAIFQKAKLLHELYISNKKILSRKGTNHPATMCQATSTLNFPWKRIWRFERRSTWEWGWLYSHAEKGEIIWNHRLRAIPLALIPPPIPEMHRS